MSSELQLPPVDSGSTVLPALGALEILAASTDAFLFVDGEFRIRYPNPAAEVRLGRPAAALYGELVWSVWTGAIAARAREELQRAASAQVTVQFSELDESAGQSCQLEITAYPAAGGLAIFVRDVTEHRTQLDEAKQAATSLWQEVAELDHRNQALTRTNATLVFAQQEAERERERLTQALEGMGDVVTSVDAQWRLLFVNEAGRLLLARLGKPGDQTGRVLWDVLPQLVGTRFEREMRRAAAERSTLEFDDYLPDTGQWMEHRVIAIPDGTILSFARDVSERHRQIDALRDSEERYRALVDAATQMVWTTDAQGMVADMPVWRELTGQTPDEVRGSGWTDAIHPDDVQRTADAFGVAVASGRPYEAQYRLRLRDGSYRWYRARGVPIHNPDGTVREWVGLFNEVDRMIRRDEGMRFLADASAALAESLDERETLDTLARLAVEGLADGAMVTLVREDGSFDHVATRSRDGQTGEYAAETERRYPLPRDAESGYPRAIRTGEPELVPPDVFDEEILPRVAADATHLERLRHLKMYSAMVVPLIARGTTLGAITLVLHGPERRRAFDANDLALAMELGRRAALALDNARLFEAERRARTDVAHAAERVQAVADATTAFAEAAMDPVRIAEALAGVLVRRLGDSCVVRLLDSEDATLHLGAVRHRDAGAEAEIEAAARLVCPRLTDGLTAKLAEPDAYLLLSGDALEAQRTQMSPSYRAFVESRQIHSTLAVALRSGERVVGTAYLSREAESLPFDESDATLVRELGLRAGLLLERARLFAAEHAARAEAERSAELTRRLQEITASFARTITVNQVAAMTLAHGADTLSAEAGLMYVMSDDGDALELLRSEGVSEEARRASHRLPLAVPSPATDAVRGGEIVYVADASAQDARYPVPAPGVDGAWALVPLVHAGRPLGAIALGFPAQHPFSVGERALLDALGRHCAQALERARLLDAEHDARDEAERANQAKSELLAKVSHETRQPVHASIGWVDTLEMELHGPVLEPQREALRRIKQNQLRLLTVLNDLLDMSRIEAGRLDLDLRAVALADVVDAVNSAVAPQLAARRIAFELCHPSPELRVRADVHQLIGILTNLLGNAAKFTPEGGTVSVRCEARGEAVEIAVSDTGIGIAADLMERVFEPFFQVESGFTRTSVGTGLGLAISREAARAMGGDVTVESSVGRGSCFTLRLPTA